MLNCKVNNFFYAFTFYTAKRKLLHLIRFVFIFYSIQNANAGLKCDKEEVLQKSLHPNHEFSTLNKEHTIYVPSSKEENYILRLEDDYLQLKTKDQHRVRSNIHLNVDESNLDVENFTSSPVHPLYKQNVNKELNKRFNLETNTNNDFELNSSNLTPHYFSSQTFISITSILSNLKPPLILHPGDIYIAYFSCIDEKDKNLEQLSNFVQSAMSAVWAAHRFNQFNLIISNLSIKLGIYYFDICNENQSNASLELIDDKLIENYLKLIELNSIHHFNNNNNIHIPKTGVRSYQRDGKQQIHTMKPIIGILADLNQLSLNSRIKLNKFDLPVINHNQLFNHLDLELENNLIKSRIFNVNPSVKQLCKAVYSLIKKLNWTFAIVNFNVPTLNLGLNEKQNEHQFTLNQKLFIKCLSKLASKDNEFTYQIEYDKSQLKESNEIMFLGASDCQVYFNSILNGSLPQKPNLIVASLNNLNQDLTNALSANLIQNENLLRNSGKILHSNSFFTTNSRTYFIMPKLDVKNEFFDFFSIELKNANTQSKHRLISKLSKQILNKFQNDSFNLTEQQFNDIWPIVHYSNDEIRNSNATYLNDQHQKLIQNLGKLNVNTNSLSKLFQVKPNLSIFYVINGIWALGLTLAKLIENICSPLNFYSNLDHKQNCIYRLEQVLDIEKFLVRNITINLKEIINLKNTSLDNNILDENLIEFDHELQLSRIKFTINCLDNNLLIPIAYHADNQDASSNQLISSSNSLFNLNIQPSSKYEKIIRQTIPIYGTRLTLVSMNKNNSINSKPNDELTSSSNRQFNKNNWDDFGIDGKNETKVKNNLQSNIKSNETIFYTNNNKTNNYAHNNQSKSEQMKSENNNLIKADQFLDKNLENKGNFNLNYTMSVTKKHPNKSQITILNSLKRQTNSSNSNQNKSSILIDRKHQWTKQTPIVFTNKLQSTLEMNSLTSSVQSSISDRQFINQLKRELDVGIERCFSIIILFLSIGGSLLTFYLFVFLVIKTLDGALKHHSYALSMLQIISILIVFISSGLYVFHNSFTIKLRNSIHNLALALFFACLIQKAVILRAQKWIGLGGKVSIVNQLITLIFIFVVQLALELQKWSYKKTVLNSTLIHDIKSIKSQTNGFNFISDQSYLILISFLLLIISFTVRKYLFGYKEGKHLFLTSLVCCPVYILSVIFLYKYLLVMAEYEQIQLQVLNSEKFNLVNKTNSSLQRISLNETKNSSNNLHSNILKLNSTKHPLDDNMNRMNNLKIISEFNEYQYNVNILKFVDLAQSFTLIVIATITLFGIFGPIVIAIHKYGVLPKKPNSYADSLSTAFTLFQTPLAQQQFMIERVNKDKQFFNSFLINQNLSSSKNLNSHKFYQLSPNKLHKLNKLSSINLVEANNLTNENSYNNLDNISEHLENLHSSDEIFTNVNNLNQSNLDLDLINRIQKQMNIGSGAQFNYATTPNYHKYKYVLNNLSENLAQSTHNLNNDNHVNASILNDLNKTKYNQDDLIRNPLYKDQFKSAYP